MSFIKFIDVSFEYPNGYSAIEDVNLEIKKGENIAIIGQNGAGKTTTAKLINGLLKPTKGVIIIDGWNTKDYTTAQISRKVGYVFQNPDDQIFHSSVYDEVAFSAKYMKLPEDEVKRRVQEAAKITDIEKYLEENPYNLPFSTRKFVTIASVLVMDSDCIILDEPTAGQDKFGMEQLGKLLKILKAKGKTIITITHDMEFVVNNFDEVIVMANKHVIKQANKREIFWDKETLEISSLEQPYISKLSSRLNLSNNIINIEEFVNCIKECYHE